MYSILLLTRFEPAAPTHSSDESRAMSYQRQRFRLYGYEFDQSSSNDDYKYASKAQQIHRQKAEDRPTFYLFERESEGRASRQSRTLV